LSRQIESEIMAKINMRFGDAKAIEILRQDLAEVKKMTNEMKKTIKGINSHVSPVEAMKHASSVKNKKK